MIHVRYTIRRLHSEISTEGTVRQYGRTLAWFTKRTTEEDVLQMSAIDSEAYLVTDLMDRLEDLFIQEDRVIIWVEHPALLQHQILAAELSVRQNVSLRCRHQ